MQPDGAHVTPRGRYRTPSEVCPPPRERPALDLEARCPPEAMARLRRLEIASTHRCLVADRRGLSRDGVTFLGRLMGLGPRADTLEALDLFGEAPFRVTLHHVHPGAMSPMLWNYWHLRLHGEPPRRPAPTVITEMKAAGALPPSTPEPPAPQWPPRGGRTKPDYGRCLWRFRRST